MNALNLFGMHILLVIQKLYKYWFGLFEAREKDGNKTFRSLAVNFAIIRNPSVARGRKRSMKIHVLYLLHGYFLEISVALQNLKT